MLYFNFRQHLRLLVFTYVTFSLILAHSTEGWLPTFFLFVCLRDFLEHDLVDFASKHPSVVVYVKPRRHRSSVIKAEYCESRETPFTTLCFLNHIAFNHFTSLSLTQIQVMEKSSGCLLTKWIEKKSGNGCIFVLLKTMGLNFVSVNTCIQIIHQFKVPGHPLLTETQNWIQHHSPM